MRCATITKIGDDLKVTYDGYHYWRLNGCWQMRGDAGNWFSCTPQYPLVMRQVADFEFCLRTYSYEEGPDYPRNKKSDVGEFFRNLQRREAMKALTPTPSLTRPKIPVCTPVSRLGKYSRPNPFCMVGDPKDRSEESLYKHAMAQKRA